MNRPLSIINRQLSEQDLGLEVRPGGHDTAAQLLDGLGGVAASMVGACTLDGDMRLDRWFVKWVSASAACMGLPELVQDDYDKVLEVGHPRPDERVGGPGRREGRALR